jgi:serine/threonine protein kinase
MQKPNVAAAGHFSGGRPMHEIRSYLYQLCAAVHDCHKSGIIHADIKPTNILVHTTTRHLKLIDFGHAQFYWPEGKYAVASLGTVGFRAPELLFEDPRIHYAIDMWSVGCVLLQSLLPSPSLWRKFRARNNYFQIQVLNRKFGTAALQTVCSKYNWLCHALPWCAPCESWPAFFRQLQTTEDSNEHPASSSSSSSSIATVVAASSEASAVAKTRQQRPHDKEPDTEERDVFDLFENTAVIDLMNGLLCLDPHHRLTAAEALKHSFFSNTVPC